MAEDAVRTRLLQNMHDLRPDYDFAQKALDAHLCMAQYYAVWKELSAYHAGDEPHKAVFLIAKCLAIAEPFASLYNSIGAYNEARHKLEEYDMRRTIENG